MINIGIDLDGVFFDLDYTFKKIHDVRGLSYSPPKQWNLYKEWPELADEIMKKLKCPDAISEVPYIIETKIINEKLKKLKHKFSFNIVTARYPKVEDITRKIIEKDILYIDNIIFANTPEGKGPALLKHNIKWHVDDSPSVISQCLSLDVKTICISNSSTPYNHSLFYNEHRFDNNLFRAENILDALDIIDKNTIGE